MLRILAVATGAAEKGVAQIYETAFRPPEKRHRPWVERCDAQMHAALADLDRRAQERAGKWLIGERMTQADITTTCVYTFLGDALAVQGQGGPALYPGLADLAVRCEALPEFRAARAEWFAPGGSG